MLITVLGQSGKNCHVNCDHNRPSNTKSSHKTMLSLGNTSLSNWLVERHQQQTNELKLSLVWNVKEHCLSSLITNSAFIFNFYNSIYVYLRAYIFYLRSSLKLHFASAFFIVFFSRVSSFFVFFFHFIRCWFAFVSLRRQRLFWIYVSVSVCDSKIVNNSLRLYWCLRHL